MKTVARSLLEQATKHLVFRRRLPQLFDRAPIIVSPSAGGLKYFKPIAKADPVLLRNAKTLVRPGDVIWDIGANVGLFTFAAAARAGVDGAVVAFEPDTWLVQLLHKSQALQSPQSAPVTIVPAAVAQSVALRTFHIAKRSRAFNSLSNFGRAQADGISARQIVVPTFNLDWLLESQPPPNLIKCDVEGAEAEVFIGQSRMLNDIRPTILCEVGPEHSPIISRLLQDHGYLLFDGATPFAPENPVPDARWCTVAIPSERREDLASFST